MPVKSRKKTLKKSVAREKSGKTRTVSARAKTAKAAKRKAAEPVKKESHHGREMLGLVFIAISIISLLSLISHFVRPGEQNILGAYVGEWWANALNAFAGSLPALLLVATVFIWGVKFIQAPDGESINIKTPLVALLLFLELSLILSVKNIEARDFNFMLFRESGGFIGNFMVHKAFIPVFGRTQFGPYLISAILIFLTLVWGFKLRIAQLFEKASEFAGLFIFPVFDAYETFKHKKRQRLAEAQQRIEDKMGAIPEVQPAKSKGRKKKLQPVETTVLREMDPVEEENLEPVLIMSRDELQKELEAPLPTDPVELRKMRDRQAEIRRIMELNNWEEQSKDPILAGLINSKKMEAELSEEITKSKKSKGKRATTDDEGPVLQKDLDEELEMEMEESVPVQLLKTKEELEAESTLEENAEEEMEEEAAPEPVVNYDPYVVPNLDDVLEEPPVQTLDYSEDELKSQARALEEQLANFKVMGKVVGICTGPVIIRYEVELAPGVKVSLVNNLSDDLAMALRAKSIRILAPIPGKSAVGIEVPNKKSQIVYIKEVLNSERFSPEPDTIKLVLGKDIAGEPSVMDLTKAPHLLIAGQTGSGKSVCINSFMASILCSKTPDEVRMILVDPKVVELKPYDSIPHLLAPVVTQPEIAIQALKWATFEMDRRYNVLARVGARNIKGYNQKFRKNELGTRVAASDNKLMPYIVIVIDELADLMMVAGKEVETSIARIAQKARAVGLHLIIATQRPSTNVITGTIKANLPTRVAFQVASQIDARTIMDKAGAEKLLGKGDMLFRSIDSPEPERMHGSFVGDDEAESLAKACAEQFVNYPHISTFDLEEDSGPDMEENIPRDAKFREAAELVVSIRQASVSLLQRRMSIGYARAGRIVDQLERAGIVGKDRGSKPREVMMDELELASFLSSGLND